MTGFADDGFADDGWIEPPPAADIVEGPTDTYRLVAVVPREAVEQLDAEVGFVAADLEF